MEPLRVTERTGRCDFLVPRALAHLSSWGLEVPCVHQYKTLSHSSFRLNVKKYVFIVSVYGGVCRSEDSFQEGARGTLTVPVSGPQLCWKAVVAHTFNSSTGEAEAARSLEFEANLDYIQSEFQGHQGNREALSQKTIKQNNA